MFLTNQSEVKYILALALIPIIQMERIMQTEEVATVQ